MSDLQFGVGLIVTVCLIFAAGVWLGAWHTRSQYKAACSPEVLRAYTEGYQECKEGK